jgi:hypothetical protein
LSLPKTKEKWEKQKRAVKMRGERNGGIDEKKG